MAIEIEEDWIMWIDVEIGLVMTGGSKRRRTTETRPLDRIFFQMSDL